MQFCDVIWRKAVVSISFRIPSPWARDYVSRGKNAEFLVLTEAEVSEGLVKVATLKKVYKCLEVHEVC